ncbi:hypothetical protein CPB84DRAFT_1686207 [Gymnopilus junonius]|uniref:Uncharacterized protein n=1 Tax=Gymnopilus junonius TaxID=109634 RepID=A0A9P5TI47_GYMJU|nr:hypothetical protein CPB84DRAFT_1686207 [Gymnopilus junonius]
MALLDSVDDLDVPFSNTGIWKMSTIKIPMPCECQKFSSEDDARHLHICGIHHCSICEVMRSAAQDDSAKSWHHIPFKLYWKLSPDSMPQRVVSELYTADMFLEEDQKIASLPLCLADDPPDLFPVKNTIFAIMLWSDSTHLANFSDASMWPIYFYSGNQSKYPRGRPTQHAAHHIVHIPSLPDDFEDIYMKKYGKPPSKSVITHMKRKIIQKVWELLLDDKFMRAYQHGIIIRCADIIVCRFFPCFFTYSVDYPEKVIIAAIHQLALCPSPQTLMPKKYISGLGTRVDEQRRQHLRLDDVAHRDQVEAAQELIFVHGIGVTGAYVEERLQNQSLTLTQSTFSKKLSEFGFNYFDMLISDLLHEIELGNWKAVFMHLMRILHLVKNAIPTLNKR